MAGYIIVALADNTVHCLYRDSLKQVSSATMSLGWHQSDDIGGKYSRKSIDVSYLDMSWLGNVLLVIDTQSQMYLYRLPPVVEPSMLSLILKYSRFKVLFFRFSDDCSVCYDVIRILFSNRT